MTARFDFGKRREKGHGRKAFWALAAVAALLAAAEVLTPEQRVELVERWRSES